MEISKKKLLATLFVIGLVAVLVTGATYTWLSDSATVGWTIEVKTAGLEVTSPVDIDFGKLAPGESASTTIVIENTGEVDLTVHLAATHTDVTLTFSHNDFDLVIGGKAAVMVTATLRPGYTGAGDTLSGTITVSGTQTH